MNRRNAIKLSTLAGGILAVPTLMSSVIFTKEKMENTTNTGPLNLHLCGIDILIFSDGQMTFNTPQPTFAPEVPKAKFDVESKKLHLSTDAVDLAINIMLVKTPNRTILIDAGMGKHFGDSQGKLLENLISAGISPDAITDILITHAHRDHIGGLVTNDDRIIFPNAQYHISNEEYGFWMSDNPDFSNSKLSSAVIKGTVAFTKKILHTIDKKIVIFNSGDTLFSIIKTELAAGHTPGHTVYTISSEGKSIKNIVDVFHTTLMVSEPEWGVSFDVNFELGIQTRKKVLQECFINQTLVMSSHLPWPGLGYIDRRDKYYWSPLNYYTPSEIQL